MFRRLSNRRVEINGVMTRCRRYAFVECGDIVHVPLNSNLPCLCMDRVGRKTESYTVSRAAAATDLRQSREIDKLPKQDGK